MRYLVRPTSSNRRRRLLPELFEERVLLTTISVTEINYNPYEPIPELGEVGAKSDDYTFIELGNTSAAAVSLEGMRLARVDDEGVDFVFGNVTLQPAERIVVAEDIEAFQSRYGMNVNLAGAWSGALSKNGETITLLAADETIIQQFAYDSDGSWPKRADGLGATLEVKDVDGNLSKASNWRSSSAYGGTPGAAPSAEEFGIIVNEVFAHSDLPQIDAIELYNPSDSAVDLSNWYLSDAIAKPTKFQVPVGTEIPGRGYAVFSENDFNPGQGANDTDFALSEFGDDVWLMAGDGQGRPTHFVDNVSFDASLNGVSMGRLPDGNAKSDMLPLDSPSFGSENSGHWPSAVVIDEVHYHPRTNDVNLEFIELRNRTQQPLALGDWRIEDAVQIVVPPATTIGVGDRIVLVAFDPADAQTADAFRAAHSIDDSATLLGPWGSNEDGEPKKLSNGGEKITLKAPIVDPIGTFYQIADQVDFDNVPPWPIAADGFGGSLQRTNPTAFGNDGGNWQAAVPSPGMAMQSAVSLHNEPRPLDVNDDGFIAPIDALLVINYLNGESILSAPAFLDTSNDGYISPLDALNVINHLNSLAAAQPAATIASETLTVGAALDAADELDSDEPLALQVKVVTAIPDAPYSRPLDLRISRVDSLFKR